MIVICTLEKAAGAEKKLEEIERVRGATNPRRRKNKTKTRRRRSSQLMKRGNYSLSDSHPPNPFNEQSCPVASDWNLTLLQKRRQLHVPISWKIIHQTVLSCFCVALTNEFSHTSHFFNDFIDRLTKSTIRYTTQAEAWQTEPQQTGSRPPTHKPSQIFFLKVRKWVRPPQCHLIKYLLNILWTHWFFIFYIFLLPVDW